MKEGDFIYFGKILRVHGISGNVVLECYFENPQDFIQNLYIKNGNDYSNFACEIIGSLKNDCVIIKKKGNESIESAQKLVNQKLFVNIKDIPKYEDGYYAFELIGMQVVDKNTKDFLGTVVDFVDFGSGVNFEVKNLQEKLEYYIYDDTVSVDFENKTIELIKPVYV